MTTAVDTVLKQEHRAFLRKGDESPLTGTKHMWLFTAESRPAQYREIRDRAVLHHGHWWPHSSRLPNWACCMRSLRGLAIVATCGYN
jgi:hypothetical protein